MCDLACAELSTALKWRRIRLLGTRLSFPDMQMTVFGGMSSGHSISALHEKSRQNTCLSKGKPQPLPFLPKLMCHDGIAN